MKHTLIATLTLICVLITLSGCGSKKPVAIPATSTSAPPTTNPINNAVLTDYRAFWADWLAVTSTMTPGNPRISAHATGDELTTLNGTVIAGHQSGSVFRGTLDLDPHVQSIVGNTATVDDCYIDHTGDYVVTTGARLDKDDLTPQKVVVTLQNINGTWMTAKIDDRTASCDRS